jgi:hypothetical protein
MHGLCILQTFSQANAPWAGTETTDLSDGRYGVSGPLGGLLHCLQMDLTNTAQPAHAHQSNNQLNPTRFRRVI